MTDPLKPAQPAKPKKIVWPVGTEDVTAAKVDTTIVIIGAEAMRPKPPKG